MTFRLTLWYAGLFGTLSLAVFLVVYVSLTSHLRQQTDGELQHTTREFEALYESQGVEALRAEFQREAQSKGIKRVFFRLLSPECEAIAASNLDAWDVLEAGRLQPAATPDGPPTLQTVSVPGRRHQVRVIATRTRDGHVIQIGATLRDADLLMERFRETFATALVVMLGCGILAGWHISRRAMLGVQRVTQTAIRIGTGDLGRRVPLGNQGQEIDELVHAFNDMLERIESLVAELQEVCDNVAHDLRGPITRMRVAAESSLAQDYDAGASREMAAAVVEESDRLVGIMNTMLEIARVDSGIAELVRERLDVREIVCEAVDLFGPVAEDQGLALQVEVPSEAVVVRGDEARLQRVVANLLDNAIKYTPAGGRVTIAVRLAATRALIEVDDTGVGIAAQDVSRIFDRFYRGDKSRSTPGSGLGLSLAFALVRAHGGDLTVTSTPGRGSTFSAAFPLLRPGP